MADIATHDDGLSKAQAERIALLLEECGEVVQVCGKILRHGIDSASPLDQSRTTNRKLLEMELGHVFHAIDRLTVAGDVAMVEVVNASYAKKSNVERWLHNQGGPE